MHQCCSISLEVCPAADMRAGMQQIRFAGADFLLSDHLHCKWPNAPRYFLPATEISHNYHTHAGLSLAGMPHQQLCGMYNRPSLENHHLPKFWQFLGPAQLLYRPQSFTHPIHPSSAAIIVYYSCAGWQVAGIALERMAAQ